MDIVWRMGKERDVGKVEKRQAMRIACSHRPLLYKEGVAGA